LGGSEVRRGIVGRGRMGTGGEGWKVGEDGGGGGVGDGEEEGGENRMVGGEERVERKGGRVGK